MILPVTLTIAAAAAVITLWLAFRIVPTRLRDRVLHGDAGDARLANRMRAHANFAEYAPFVLVLMALIELAGGATFWLWAIGVAFVLGRIVHVIGMDLTRPNPWRAGGAVATWIVLALLAGWALAIAYGGMHRAGPIPLAPAMMEQRG